MFTVTITTTRPNTGSVWFKDAPEYATENAMMESLRSDPLIVSLSNTLSEDGLTLVKAATFNSYNDYQSWITKIIAQDSTYLTKRNNYVIDQGQTLKIEESVDGATPIVEKQL